jgi:hypothetical protein
MVISSFRVTVPAFTTASKVLPPTLLGKAGAVLQWEASVQLAVAPSQMELVAASAERERRRSAKANTAVGVNKECGIDGVSESERFG